MNCTYTSTGYPTLFWYVQYLSKVCSFFRKRQWKTAKTLEPETLKTKAPLLWNTPSRYQTQPCTTVFWETQCQGHRGSCTKLQGPTWGVQWGWEPQTEETWSPSQSAGTSLEDREKQNQLWLPLIPGAQQFSGWIWGEGKGSQIMCLLSIRPALPCPWGFPAECLGIKF